MVCHRYDALRVLTQIPRRQHKPELRQASANPTHWHLYHCPGASQANGQVSRFYRSGESSLATVFAGCEKSPRLETPAIVVHKFSSCTSLPRDLVTYTLRTIPAHG